MNIFVFLFAGAMVLTFIAITPRTARRSAQYPPGYYETGGPARMGERTSEQEPGTFMILIYTIIFVSALLTAMSTLA